MAVVVGEKVTVIRFSVLVKGVVMAALDVELLGADRVTEAADVRKRRSPKAVCVTIVVFLGISVSVDKAVVQMTLDVDVAPTVVAGNSGVVDPLVTVTVFGREVVKVMLGVASRNAAVVSVVVRAAVMGGVPIWIICRFLKFTHYTSWSNLAGHTSVSSESRKPPGVADDSRAAIPIPGTSILEEGGLTMAWSWGTSAARDAAKGLWLQMVTAGNWTVPL